MAGLADCFGREVRGGARYWQRLGRRGGPLAVGTAAAGETRDNGGGGGSSGGGVRGGTTAPAVAAAEAEEWGAATR